jgi:putative spermidine/putrescine transport system ATP-binding protein
MPRDEAITASELAGSELELRLVNLEKRYGALLALDNVNLTVAVGEFLTLLGPSGSGKTTLLMAIAGFVTLDAGDILVGRDRLTNVLPQDRNFGVVFQGYALFPHMTVAENIAFPLRVRRHSKASREDSVRKVLDLVQMGSYADRLPRQLSGGQQQRVAIARALVFDPAILLLDEPMSALDRKLRGELQSELKALHRRLGRTFIMVTHDQDEAMVLSDRVAILDQGRLLQTDTPRNVYSAPATRFVADFLGKSNFISGKVIGVDEGLVRYRAGCFEFTQAVVDRYPAVGDAITISLRPEALFPTARPEGDHDNVVHGIVVDVSFLGSQQEVIFDITALGRLIAVMSTESGAPLPRVGERIRFGWRNNNSMIVQGDIRT